MGGINRGANWWWRYFKALLFNLHTSVKGEIVLSYGQHELNIAIDPEIRPLFIYVNCSDMDIPTCVGNASLVSARLLPDNSFNLYADVKANSCTVEWLIEYDPDVN